MGEESVRITRCKFRCNSIKKTVGYGSNRLEYVAEFGVQADGSEETKRFFQYTPSGTLTVGTYKDDVFQPGKFYYLDISEAPD